MRYSIILVVLILFFQNCQSQELKRDSIKFSEPSIISKRKNVLVSATADGKIYIGSKEIPITQLDSILRMEISNKRDHIRDTVTVVINADTATKYGVVYKIMKTAKGVGAKVVANVK